MDKNCQLTGAYPHFSSILSLITGSPSPPPSIFGEPIQSPIGFRFRELQLKSPRIQVLNKTMGDTERKNDPVCKKAGLELAALSYKTKGSSKSILDSAHFGNKHIWHSVPKLKTTPFHYPFQYPHLESWRQIACVKPWDHNQQQSENQLEQKGALTFPITISLKKRNIRNLTVTKHCEQDTDLPSSTLIKPETFDCGTAIKQKPVNLWPKPSTTGQNQGAATSQKKRNKQKILPRVKRKWIKRKNKLLHKTELCTHWALTSTCRFKDRCFFAHGIDELKNRIRPTNYKTRLCADCAPKDRRDGRCTYGSRCNYCHPGEAIRRNIGSAYFDRDYYKDLMNNFKDNEYPFGIFI